MGARLGLRQFGEPEVQNLEPPIFREEQVFGLEVAMNDPFFVGGGQPVRDLQGIVQSLADGDRSAAQALSKGLSFEQFGDHVRTTLDRANVEYRQDVGMVQGSGGECLLLKTAEAVGVKGHCLRQNLDRHFTFEARVPGAIDLAHAARAQQRNNLIRP